jgi:homoaconitate hydratase
VFREAAERGDLAKVHPKVEFYLAAASKAEQQAAEEAGDWQVLEQAGAKVLPSGCGPCIGLVSNLVENTKASIS